MSLRFAFSVGLLALTVAPLGACSIFSPSSSSDESVPDAAAISDFCAKAAQSPVFSCCSPDDQKADEFTSRYQGLGDAETCKTLLRGDDLSKGDGERRTAFDAARAQRCLDFLASQPCGFIVDEASRKALTDAGCDFIVGGTGDVGAACQSHSECKDGLHCAKPPGDLGDGKCAAPLPEGGDCSTTAVTDSGIVSTLDASGGHHPLCAEGLGCSVVGQCIPVHPEGGQCELDQDCVSGLTCHVGVCGTAPPSDVGGKCATESDCAAGLYCGTKGCVARKAAGASCTPHNTFNHECLGYCEAGSDFISGTCVAFCGSK